MMKISELILILQDHLQKHGDLEVKTTWESTVNYLDPDNIYRSKRGELYLDADCNSYKREFAVDVHEGE